MVALAGVLGCLELLLQAFGFEPPGAFTNLRYESDPMTGPQAMPLQVGFARSSCFTAPAIHINRFGMRDRERKLTASHTRIALIGDSIVEGLQVRDDETVSRRLEALLQDRADVLNFGVSSTGTAVQFLQYAARVRPFHPEIVVVVLWVENDAIDNVPSMKQRRDPYMARVSPYLLPDEHGGLRLQPGAARRTPKALSLLVSTAAGRWIIYARRLATWPAAGESGQTKRSVGGGTAPESEEAAAWELTEQIIARFHAQVRSDGAHFALAVVPAGMESLGLTGHPSEATQVAVTRLQALAQREGFPLADLSHAFQAVVEREGPTPFVYACDGHWNPRGHWIAAEAIQQFLEQQRWL